MKLTSRYWADHSARDFAHWRASGLVERIVAVLPLGATEQHGPHLSCGVDTVLSAELLGGMAALRAKSLALDYLVKPVEAERLEFTVQKLKRLKQNEYQSQVSALLELIQQQPQS